MKAEISMVTTTPLSDQPKNHLEYKSKPLIKKKPPGKQTLFHLNFRNLREKGVNNYIHKTPTPNEPPQNTQNNTFPNTSKHAI